MNALALATTNHTSARSMLDRAWRDLNPYAISARVTVALAAWALANPAFAETQAYQALNTIKNMLSGGMTFLGGAMSVFGAVTIGINVHNGASGNGSAIATGVATLIGGVVIAAAGVYFGGLDIDWANN